MQLCLQSLLSEVLFFLCRRVTREASRAKDMAPPPASAPAVHPVVREVTEDTPPDLLEGTMDLKAILPSGKAVQSTVDRK